MGLLRLVRRGGASRELREALDLVEWQAHHLIGSAGEPMKKIVEWFILEEEKKGSSVKGSLMMDP